MKLGFRTGLTDSRDSLPIATLYCFCLFNNLEKSGKKGSFASLFLWGGKGDEGEEVLFVHIWRLSARGACRVWNALVAMLRSWSLFSSLFIRQLCGLPCKLDCFSGPRSKESISYSKSSACCWKRSSDRLWYTLITEDGDFQPLDRKISCDVFYGIFRARVYSQNERSPKKCCLLWAPWAY